VQLGAVVRREERRNDNGCNFTPAVRFMRLIHPTVGSIASLWFCPASCKMGDISEADFSLPSATTLPCPFLQPSSSLGYTPARRAKQLTARCTCCVHQGMHCVDHGRSNCARFPRIKYGSWVVSAKRSMCFIACHALVGCAVEYGSSAGVVR
jgi:hypothetical protein